MWTKFWALIEVVKGLFHLFDFLRDKLRKEQLEKKEEALEKAVDDSKVAKTEEEFFDAQERIVNNR